MRCMVPEREAIVNTRAQDPNERAQPVRPDSSIPPIGIHMTREEFRLRRLHDLAIIFESAFEVQL
jgi:hypothetical protein